MAYTSVDVASLHAALDAARTTKQLSWRQLAGELDVVRSRVVVRVLDDVGDRLVEDHRQAKRQVIGEAGAGAERLEQRHEAGDLVHPVREGQ